MCIPLFVILSFYYHFSHYLFTLAIKVTIYLTCMTRTSTAKKQDIYKDSVHTPMKYLLIVKKV